MDDIETLRKVKHELGEITWIDFTAYDLPEAHYLLGQDVSRQVHKILRRRLEYQSAASTGLQMGQAIACKNALACRIADEGLAEPVRSGISDYLACLAAWSDGVGLAGFTHPALPAGDTLNAIDLALFLQHDSSGCQSGVYRSGGSSVILWHSEEDIEPEPGSGFDKLRIASFRVAGGDPTVTMHAFIYPDLLPGPAFGWRSDGYAQAADLLYIKSLPIGASGTLANITTWLALRLGRHVPAVDLIQAMLPCFDGYALNIIQVEAGIVQARKYEFAANIIIPHQLGDAVGSFLYQANRFTNSEDPRVREIEDLSQGECEWFERRMDYTTLAMKNIQDNSSLPDQLHFFTDLLCSQNSAGGSYSNAHVKAYFIYRQIPDGAEILLGHGPAVRGDDAKKITIAMP